jgi:hypothetical protein
MRLAYLPRLVLSMAFVVVAGCSSNTDKIKGTWVSEAATLKGEELSAGARVLQFEKDGHLVFTVAGKPYKGSYSLGMGPAVTFTLEEDLDGRKVHPQKVVINDDQLTLTSADGSELTFRKAPTPN